MIFSSLLVCGSFRISVTDAEGWKSSYRHVADVRKDAGINGLLNPKSLSISSDAPGEDQRDGERIIHQLR